MTDLFVISFLKGQILSACQIKGSQLWIYKMWWLLYCFADTLSLTDWYLLCVCNLPYQVCITRHGQVQSEGQWPWGQRGGGQWLWHGSGIPRGQAAAGGRLFWPYTPWNAPSPPPRWAFGNVTHTVWQSSSISWHHDQPFPYFLLLTTTCQIGSIQLSHILYVTPSTAAAHTQLSP